MGSEGVGQVGGRKRNTRIADLSLLFYGTGPYNSGFSLKESCEEKNLWR